MVMVRNKPTPIRAHRDCSTVWITDNGEKESETLMRHSFATVSEAKKWMNNPTLSI